MVMLEHMLYWNLINIAIKDYVETPFLQICKEFKRKANILISFLSKEFFSNIKLLNYQINNRMG